MAKVEFEQREVTSLEESVELTLSREEVTFLSVVLQNIGGSSEGYRGYSDELNTVLREAFRESINPEDKKHDGFYSTPLGVKMQRKIPKTNFIFFDGTTKDGV